MPNENETVPCKHCGGSGTEMFQEFDFDYAGFCSVCNGRKTETAETVDGITPRESASESYLGDAVYASFDGYQIWLRTGDCNHHRIALEPGVYRHLLRFAASIGFAP